MENVKYLSKWEKKGGVRRLLMLVFFLLMIFLVPLTGMAKKVPFLNIVYTVDIRGTLFPCA